MEYPGAALNAAVFYYDYSDLQVQIDLGGSTGAFIENAATARLYGLDLDGTWRATDELTFTGGLNLLSAHFVNEQMGAALNTASSLDAYVLADRGTWLSFQNRGDLTVLKAIQIPEYDDLPLLAG